MPSVFGLACGEGELPLSGESLQSPLPPHGACEVRLRLDVCQPQRSARPGVAGSAAGTVLLQAALGICRPASVECAISTLDDIAVILGHAGIIRPGQRQANRDVSAGSENRLNG